jgi:hypothetical protein
MGGWGVSHDDGGRGGRWLEYEVRSPVDVGVVVGKLAGVGGYDAPIVQALGDSVLCQSTLTEDVPSYAGVMYEGGRTGQWDDH